MRSERVEPPQTPLPRTNPLLLGHAPAEAQVANWISKGRLGQALMICGPHGIGKATWAFRIARALLRQRAPAEEQGAGQGPPPVPLLPELPSSAAAAATSLSEEDRDDQTFRWVASAAHPDLLIVERRFDEKRGRQLGEIVVDDIRRIAGFLGSSSALGGWRVVIVDAADEMNRNAANALLKVLEEPNYNSVLLLVSHQPRLLPPTVRSRCRRIVLRPLDDDIVERLLVRYRPTISQADREILVALAEGSIGDALQLTATEGIANWRTLAAAFAALAENDSRPLFACAADPNAGGDADNFRSISHMLSWWLRKLARTCAVGPAGELAIAAALQDSTPVLRRLAGKATLDRWLKVWDKTHHLATQAATGNLDRKQVLSTLLLDLVCEVRSTGR